MAEAQNDTASELLVGGRRREAEEEGGARAGAANHRPGCRTSSTSGHHGDRVGIRTAIELADPGRRRTMVSLRLCLAPTEYVTKIEVLDDVGIRFQVHATRS